MGIEIVLIQIRRVHNAKARLRQREAMHHPEPLSEKLTSVFVVRLWPMENSHWLYEPKNSVRQTRLPSVLPQFLFRLSDHLLAHPPGGNHLPLGSPIA